MLALTLDGLLKQSSVKILLLEIRVLEKKDKVALFWKFNLIAFGRGVHQTAQTTKTEPKSAANDITALHYK